MGMYWFASQLTQHVQCKLGPREQLSARVQEGFDLVLGHRKAPDILAYVKKGCVHIRSPRVPTSGTVNREHQV